jgi:CheY-specific phosphatase CheX
MPDKKKYTLSDNATRLVLEKSVRHAFEGNFKCPVLNVSGITQGDLEASSKEAIMSPYIHISGDFTGTICVQMPRGLVQELAMSSLGFDAFKEEIFAGDQILVDASGEIVNMISGTFKNMLSRVKMSCHLMPPQTFSDDKMLIKYLFAATNRWFLNLDHGEFQSQVILFTRKAR